MDTIVFGTGMPCMLAFLDHDIADVVATWESWVQAGQFVRARHEDPTRDAIIGFLPAAIGTVEFVPHHPYRRWPDPMLWSNPHLQAHTNTADLPPEKAHYWTLNPAGFSARFVDTMPAGAPGLILGHWEPGRL